MRQHEAIIGQWRSRALRESYVCRRYWLCYRTIDERKTSRRHTLSHWLSAHSIDTCRHIVTLSPALHVISGGININARRKYIPLQAVNIGRNDVEDDEGQIITVIVVVGLSTRQSRHNIPNVWLRHTMMTVNGRTATRGDVYIGRHYAIMANTPVAIATVRSLRRHYATGINIGYVSSHYCIAGFMSFGSLHIGLLNIRRVIGEKVRAMPCRCRTLHHMVNGVN